MRAPTRALAKHWQWRAFCTSCGQQNAPMLELWAWGKGGSGQLGSGDDSNHKTPHLIARMEAPPNLHLAPMQGLASKQRPISNLFTKLGFLGSAVQGSSDSRPSGIGLSCGLFHSAMLVDGELWTWGKGEAGRLGLGSEIPKYKPVSNPYLDDVSCFALGGLHSAAVSGDGKLYTWGFGAFGALGHGRYKAELMPRHLILQEGGNDTVKYVSAGGSHSAAVTSTGDLYTWGRDEGEGRLGHGDDLITDEGAVSVPLHVYLMPKPVDAVSCGGFFTMALTSEGQVWNWGGNANYELGRGDTQSRCKPSPIPHLESLRVVQLASGGFHSAVLTDDGKVLTWGRGGDGQLGHGSMENVKIPKIVEALAHLRIVYITCGSFSTAAITDTGLLYMWGKNKDYQLGFRGKMDAENVPQLVTFNEEYNDSDKYSSVVAVAIGACHAIGLVLN